MRKLILPVIFSLVLVLMAFKEYNTEKTATLTKEWKSSEAANGLVVLELFTSQGCSSCPPADAFLHDVQNLYPDNVLALSYHVDYWNYIGWEDPFSSSDYTQKQRNYNTKFRSRSNYTPQLVINGKEHLVGSHKTKIINKIDSYKNLEQINPISFQGKRVDDKFVFSYEVEGNLKDKELRLVTVLNERITQVKRGENRNRSLKNANIVVGEKTIPLKVDNGEGAVLIPDMVTSKDKVSVFLLVQDHNLDITGGAKLALGN